MTPDAITSWLSAPATLPDDTTIDKALHEWPWFVPVHLMNAVREHQKAPFSPHTLTTVQLYSDSWLPAYCLLITEKGAQSAQEAVAVADNNELKTNASVVDNPPDLQPQEVIPETDEPLIQPL